MDNLENFLIAMLPALFSSILTACFLRINDHANRKFDILNSRQVLAKALHAELINFFKIYDSIKLPPDCPWNGNDVIVSHISQKYITVYGSQLNQLGILDKVDISYIIRLYINVTALIDSRNQLNAICKEHIDYSRKMVADPSKSPFGKMVDAYKLALQYQENVYELYPDVLKRLAKYDISKED